MKNLGFLFLVFSGLGFIAAFLYALLTLILEEALVGKALPKACFDPKRRQLILPFSPAIENVGADDAGIRFLRAFLYLVALGWLFIGVAGIANLFIGAIEHITSKRVTKRFYDVQDQTWKTYTVTIWNSTVANLTLLALGSSAPEILLSIIELLGNSFFSGDLGPGTIVGSASFNLFVIVGVSLFAVKSGVKKIKNFQVYLFTAGFSLFAYLWLIFILRLVSPNVVEVWEGVLTFLLFPVLVSLAFVIDRFSQPAKSKVGLIGLQRALDRQTARELQAAFRNTQGTLEDNVESGRAAHIVSCLEAVPPFKPLAPRPELPTARVFFSKKTTICRESDKFVSLHVIVERLRPDDRTVITARLRTRPGTALPDRDYEPVEQTLEFDPDHTALEVQIPILHDGSYSPDAYFWVELTDPHGSNSPQLLDGKFYTQVIIIDDDYQGSFKFEDNCLHVLQSQVDLGQDVMLKVQRFHSLLGSVKMAYITESDTAVGGLDYEDTEGTLYFVEGESTSYIHLNLLPVKMKSKVHSFRLALMDLSSGARFEGGEDRIYATVYIYRHMEDLQNSVRTRDQTPERVESKGTFKKKLRMGCTLYVAKLRNLFDFPSGLLNRIHFVLYMPFNILFSLLVPPTIFFGGWLTFFASLALIAGLTALIGDLASLFGCVANLPDAATAVTVVALGTSLPDLFASVSTARNDQYADASVGNVTGSNSVNVFLGLGAPYLIGSIYHAIDGNKAQIKRFTETEDAVLLAAAKKYHGLVVKTEGLEFSIILFTLLSVSAFSFLYYRRASLGGELGGSKSSRTRDLSIFVLFWVTYLSMSVGYFFKAESAKT